MRYKMKYNQINKYEGAEKQFFSVKIYVMISIFLFTNKCCIVF